MLIRLSQKLATKIKTPVKAMLPLLEDPLADWSASVFVANRVQYVIFTNTASLYSTVLRGAGITNDRQFLDRSLGSLREFMAADGLEFLYLRLIAPSTTSYAFSKALKPSMTGSMNDLVYRAKLYLAEAGLSPLDTAFRLNSIPYASLRSYQPREVFTALLSGDAPMG